MTRVLLAALAATMSSVAFASNWEVDPGHSSASFSVRHMMVSNVRGTMGDVSGKVDLNDKDITKSSVDVSIDVKGIDTKNKDRDKHLRGKEFFDVERFPTMTFKSTKIEKGVGEKLKISGDLTMHGVTKAVTFDAEVAAQVANPFTKAPTRGVSATATINRKDFGLMWNAPIETGGFMVADEVNVTIEAELLKKDAAPAATSAKK